MSPKLYDIEPVIGDPRLSKLLDAKIPFLRDEFIRIVQNSMRNDRTRNQFTEFFAKEKILMLAELLVETIKTQEPLFYSIIGLFINYTASCDLRFAEYLHQNNVTDTILQ